ncbi:tRNA lysidine(34) synthetase [Fusibacillus kribbianus]|uniref:ATP-binding protein n=1 Tax=Fusibacillus kribbianus TaxID=3044208 RepID=A0AAP4EZM4_9FIRM|nr:ATP-binding protein [Ruminococcus sp. YH-rum2234]MDI9243221.1 ATP-binding protein [Ruminococcus sp. YH-rum2234]
MNLQKLLSYTRRAVDDYGMIESGDKIAVGISGGKDSLALLYALNGLKRFYPNPFTIEAITVSVFKEMDLTPIKALCEELNVPYTVISTEIGEIVFKERKEENPCSLCAKMRKGAFNEQAKALGCNKVAYAHHKDDIVETMLMSLIYEGRFHSFSPYTYLDRMDLTVIRPLMYVPEADIIGFKNQYHLPVCKNPCPADGHTRREYVKNVVRTLTTENPGAKERMFTAIVNGKIPGWPEKTPGNR